MQKVTDLEKMDHFLRGDQYNLFGLFIHINGGALDPEVLQIVSFSKAF